MRTKICSICRIRKVYTEFRKRGPLRKDEVGAYCKQCSAERSRKEREALKIETFSVYGGEKCACCGLVGHLSFFALDHIENNGADERRRLNVGTGVLFYKVLKKMGWPKGYQVLCHTCNVAKEIMGGICPHQFIGESSNRQDTAL